MVYDFCYPAKIKRIGSIAGSSKGFFMGSKGTRAGNGFLHLSLPHLIIVDNTDRDRLDWTQNVGAIGAVRMGGGFQITGSGS
jgi:hypothetical protein